MYLRITYNTSKVKNSPYRLIKYRDRNYARDPKDCKSVIRYCFFINGDIISWCNKKQRIVSNSTTEAEYIALGHVV